MYLVSEDMADETAVFVIELWDDKAAHDASLQNEQVRTLIAEAMPLMGGQPSGSELNIIGGYGLA